MATLNEDLRYIKRAAQELQNDEPQRFPTDDEAAKGMNESEPFDLPKNPETWELREALGMTRHEVGMAMDSTWSAIEELRDMLEDLKRHRHDKSKSFTGKPEY